MKRSWEIVIRIVVGFVLSFVSLLLFGIIGTLLGGNGYLGGFEFAGLSSYEAGGLFLGLIGAAFGAALGIFAVDYYEKKPSLSPFVGAFSVLLWMIFLGFVIPNTIAVIAWQNSFGLFLPLVGAILGFILKK